MLIKNLSELLNYIKDDNNSYSKIEFSSDFSHEEMINYLVEHKDDYYCELFLAYCYEKGYGVKKDLKKSFSIYEHFAKEGNAKAQNNLALCYDYGDGIEANKEEAFKWYMKSAEQGFARAQYNIALCYANGKGVESNKEEAFKWWMKSAEQGYAKAQYNLALCYDYGYGIESNKEEAFKWWMKSAEQGVKEAQYNLAICYDYGEGVESNKEEAFKWYKKSAEQGHAEAQYNLAICYANGEGVEANIEEAFKWYKKSAEQGNAQAQNNLGVCYEKGEGVEANKEEAFKWYKESAEQGVKEAQNNLGVCYEKGNGVEANIEEAFKLYKKSAEQGHAEAQYNLAALYERGEGVEQNLEEAVKWWMKSAEQDNAEAQYNLALCYNNGEGVEVNKEEAFKWYKKSAEQGFVDAQFHLASCYYFGKAVEINKEEAVKWWMKSAEQGDAQAQYNLGVCYEKGEGVEKNKEEAFKMYEKSAEQDYAPAQYNIGGCYYFGDGVKANEEEAFKWWMKSAEQGYAKAQYNLGVCYEQGDGIEKKLEEALYWYKKAYDNGYTQCKDLIREIDGLIKKQKGNILSENIDVFFSWSHHNETDMLNAEAELKKARYSVWQSNSKALGDLDEAVKEGIRKAKGYIIFLSHDAFSSSYIPKEIDMIFDVLKERGISKPTNIKLYVLGDDTHSVDDVIAELKAQEGKNSFEKLIKFAIDFNKDENKISSLLDFTEIVVKDALFREYRDNLKESYDIFPVTLSDVINQLNDETIIASLTFEKGYINRDLEENGKKYSVDDILNYDYKPILIYGAGGTGKSLYLKNLIRTNLDNNKLFFYLPCSIIKTKIDNTNNLLDVIKSISLKEEKYFHIREDLSNILINDNLDFYIIIDALDEALDKAKLIVDMVIDFYKNNRENNSKNNIHIIFTSRNFTDHILIANNNIDSLNLKIKNMDDKDISKLFDNLFERQKVANKTKENNKFSFISKEAFMQTLKILSDDIKKNPLLISNLIYIYFVTNKLYKQKYEIIDKSEELLIKALENEKTIETDIFDAIGLSAREILTKLSYDLCVTNELNVIKQFKEYIKVKNENFDDNQLDDYAKKLYNHLKARKIITGNSISHEMYRSYFAACYIYNKVYKIEQDEIDDKYIVFKNKDNSILIRFIEKYMKKTNGLWPTITVDFIAKLDYEMHYYNSDNDNNSLSYDTFDQSLNDMLKEDGISKEAYLGLDKVIKKRLLFFFEFISKYMKRNI